MQRDLSDEVYNVCDLLDLYCEDIRTWGHFPRMIDIDSKIYYLLLRAKPVHLILLINNFIAGSNSGNLLHFQCASKVFWYPQSNLLIFSDSESLWKKSRNLSLHQEKPYLLFVFFCSCTFSHPSGGICVVQLWHATRLFRWSIWCVWFIGFVSWGYKDMRTLSPDDRNWFHNLLFALTSYASISDPYIINKFYSG